MICLVKEDKNTDELGVIEFYDLAKLPKSINQIIDHWLSPGKQLGLLLL